MTVATKLREMADWYDSAEGRAMIADKDLMNEGIRRGAIIWMLHDQNDENSRGNDLLMSVITNYYFELDFDRRVAIEPLLVAASNERRKVLNEN